MDEEQGIACVECTCGLAIEFTGPVGAIAPPAVTCPDCGLLVVIYGDRSLKAREDD